MSSSWLSVCTSSNERRTRDDLRNIVSRGSCPLPWSASSPVCSRARWLGQRDRARSRFAASDGAIWKGDGSLSAWSEKAGPVGAPAVAAALAASRTEASEEPPRRRMPMGESRLPNGEVSRSAAIAPGEVEPGSVLRLATLSSGRRDVLWMGEDGPAVSNAGIGG
eukprot:scaffold236557_cov28-Tisochrysis_lutea.AAC.5